MLAARTLSRPAAKAAAKAPVHGLRPLPVRGSVVAKAVEETNLFVNLFSSAAAASVVAGVTIATAENRDEQIQKLQDFDALTLAPFGVAALVDTLVHSVAGVNVLTTLLTEPLGAAAGVAYMMTLVLSAQQVDPKTLAPEGTILNQQKAADSRAAVRVPFTKIIPTALKTIDWENTASSGAGWTIGEGGLPKLPINSVLIVLGVGGLVLELASHAPVLTVFMPRVLQVAGWLALTGYAIESFELEKKFSS